MNDNPASPTTASSESIQIRMTAALPEYIVRAAVSGDVNEVLLYTNELTPSDRQDRRDDKGRALLHLACLSPSILLLNELVQKYHVPLDTVDYSGAHPLHVAVGCGHFEHAAYLLGKGTSPLITDGSGLCPIHHALSNGFSAVAQVLRDHGGGEDEAAKRTEELKTSSRFLRHGESLALLWREAEDILRLRVSTLLTPLPWDAPPSDQVLIAFSKSPARVVAGLLYVDGQFLFGGVPFSDPEAFASPFLTNVSCLVFKSLSLSLEVHCFTCPQRGTAVVRCVNHALLTTPAANPLDTPTESHQSSLPQREAQGQEAQRLMGLSPPARNAILCCPLKQLATSSTTIAASFRWWRTVQRFRDVMNMVVKRIVLAKHFLMSSLASKRAAVALMRRTLANFEQYAMHELSQLTHSYFPLIEHVMQTTQAQKDAIILHCIVLRKKNYLRKKEKAFRYFIPLHRLCEVLAEELDVSTVALALRSRGSFLPRAAMLALQRNPSSAHQMARSRVVAVIQQLAEHFLSHTSFAEEMKATHTTAADDDSNQQTSHESKPQHFVTPAPPNHRDRAPPVGDSSSTAVPVIQLQRYALECDSRSPIPHLVGSRQALRLMLVPFKSSSPHASS